jgi:hypothetical protein
LHDDALALLAEVCLHAAQLGFDLLGSPVAAVLDHDDVHALRLGALRRRCRALLLGVRGCR